MQNQSEILTLRAHLERIIVGQDALLDRLLIALLTGGHVLLEGPPGLAKTTAVKAMASGVHASFQRIQFTPDLMPSDLTGSDIYDPESKSFSFIEGPVFNEIVLADEINRAPPKVQSALLEAMQEHQVTTSGVTRPLPDLFIVLATQNPLEQNGTYPLPEAQLDRFLLHIVLDYPNIDDELKILKQDRQHHFGEDSEDITTGLKPETILKARREVAEIHVEESLEKYIVNLVGATRNIGELDSKFSGFIEYGASPRASIALLRAASANAYLHNREYVIPEDIIEMAADVLRHRIIPSFDAHAAGISRDQLVKRILECVQVP